jgi:hypothetical protein
MHENEVIAIYYILDLICADEYLKFYVENRLKRMDSRYWDIKDLLETFIKIRNQIKEFNEPEIKLAITPNLTITIEKNN